MQKSVPLLKQTLSWIKLPGPIILTLEPDKTPAAGGGMLDEG